MKAEIAAERCIGAGTCVTTVSTVFTQSDQDGIAVVLKDPIPAEFQSDVERAADLCPVQAILLSRSAAASSASG